MSYAYWKELSVDVSQVLLDYDNPRVFIDDPTQDTLLRFLIDQEGSIELANGIYLNRGLPLAEKPVVILEKGKYVVVEGNRRVSACKILYDPSLLEKAEVDKVPSIDLDMKKYLENLPVVLAPSRDSAEPFITSRHAGEKGIKRWSTIATTKRYINRYRKGESINHIARVLGETAANVRKGIRFFMFLEYIRNQLSWTEKEKEKLEIYKMETTKLDRFLPFSKRAKEVLKIDFLPDHSVTTTLPTEKFNTALKIIIERVYLHDEIDTRSTMEDVFNSQIISMCQDDSGEDTRAGSGGDGQGDGGGNGQGSGGGNGQGSGGGNGQGDGGGNGQGSGGGSGQGDGDGNGQGSGGGNGQGDGGGNGQGSGGGNGQGSGGGDGQGVGDGNGQGDGGGNGQGGGGGNGQGSGGGDGQGVGDGNGHNGTGRGATSVEKYYYLTGAYPFTNRYKTNKRINALIRGKRQIKCTCSSSAGTVTIKATRTKGVHMHDRSNVAVPLGETN